MATKQDAQTSQQQNPQQQPQGQESTRSSQQAPQTRRGGYPLGFVLTPGDVFRMTPFSLMRRMTEEIDRIFGELGQGGRGNVEEIAWSPRIEVTEEDGKYVIKAELAGVNPEDVKLEITDDSIVLQGERKVEREEDKGGVHVSERHYGRFFRRIPLPERSEGRGSARQLQQRRPRADRSGAATARPEPPDSD